MDLKEFETYLKNFVPKHKTVDNLMKIAAYIQGKGFLFLQTFLFNARVLFRCLRT